jgi:DNA-binding CsgD family transcriptional regulator
MLSKREYQISELIAWGASDKEVASELCIALDTVRTHRQRILSKLHAHNSADLTRWFFQNKLLLSFGVNPRTISHLAGIMLVLVVFAEVSNLTYMRTKPARKAETVVRRSVRKTRKTFNYAA